MSFQILIWGIYKLIFKDNWPNLLTLNKYQIPFLIDPGDSLRKNLISQYICIPPLHIERALDHLVMQKRPQYLLAEARIVVLFQLRRKKNWYADNIDIC